MPNIIEQLQLLLILIKLKAPFAFQWLAILWFIHLINLILGYRLNLLGIWPRQLFGALGIFCSPFLHANFNHLFFNSFPLFILMLFVLIKGDVIFFQVSVLIIFLSGLGTWIFGRTGIHVGASGLIMGYWGYLFSQTYHHPDLVSIILIILLLYYFGFGFIASLLPSQERSSWEGHVLGFISGIIVSLYFPYLVRFIPV